MKTQTPKDYSVIDQPYYRKIDAVILCDGIYPSSKEPLKLLEEADFIVCCDGASNKYLSRGKVPDLIIGDCDSILPKYKKLYGDIIIKNPDQNDNDQTKAVEYLYEKGMKNVVIVGATGLRDDHTIGNVSLLLKYRSMGIKARTLTDYGLFIPCAGETKINAFIGQQISVFNFGAKNMKAEGLYYPIDQVKNLWEGTLNEAAKKTVIVKAEGEYILYLNYR